MDSGEGVNKMSSAIPKFNIRDTKKHYSELNNIALKGIEVITFNANNETEMVSHIKTSYLDQLLSNLIFKPEIEFDEEIGIHTVSLPEIDLYGEGPTLEAAINNLLDSVLEFLTIYVDKLDIFSKVESDQKQLYLFKLLRCHGDRDSIKEAIGL
ncbi:MAG: hypothetical protein VB084_02965 [Syntrophomonadaceae bacterium]|nr:hypothetical protein [Syntrophomonadaceae bacterium]